ncbi:phasin family protein [Bacillus sp. V59.32b]|uniref:phasin family protein n=1 Tax=Bacillus sp. V59.32b TaxID=1758642 RepID=UPI000E3BF482|nr:polyhydroxyalkanoate synthesis regulator [Bacillus sp. V59.32b]RFU60132.1 polyhydroxyalkanoate synthesis regulator [Bacillus sp. V59.32b]
MRDILKKGFALGLGAVITSKEQAEKLVDELVKKGEISRGESKEFVNELIQKGEETQNQIDEMIQKRQKELLDRLNLATKEDIQRLEQRISALEKANNNNNL